MGEAWPETVAMNRHGAVPDLAAPKVEKAFRVVSGATALRPSIGVILGSGQGGFSRRLAGAEYIPYGRIPSFFQPRVPGHEGVLSVGRLGDREVAVLEGRIHLYEGYFMRDVVFPVRLLHRLGVRDLIVCNASGGLNPRFAPGDVMIISDHLNLMGTNPLIGQSHQSPGNSFVNMTAAYDERHRELAAGAGASLGESLREGVLAAVAGPCYETPAESRMLSALGADAVTMSTVPEVIMARFLGLRVLGLSLVTNIHTPGTGINHQEVLNIAHRKTGFLMDLLERIVRDITPAGDHAAVPADTAVNVESEAKR
jgi:purine-nucleoside phosphorylase